MHPNVPNLAALLPPMAAVLLAWRKTMCQAVGIEVSAFHLQDVAGIAAGRTISTLSTRYRERRLLDIVVAANA
ncbi:MAG: hypothetical protein AB2556_25140 [Candidatus Thiodiazotropha sp.]